MKKVMKKAEGKAAKSMMKEFQIFGIIENDLKGVYNNDLQLSSLEVETEYGTDILKDGEVFNDFEIACTDKSCHVINTDTFGFSCSLSLANYVTNLISQHI